jgi:hypothetical protein
LSLPLLPVPLFFLIDIGAIEPSALRNRDVSGLLISLLFLIRLAIRCISFIGDDGDVGGEDDNDGAMINGDGSVSSLVVVLFWINPSPGEWGRWGTLGGAEEEDEEEMAVDIAVEGTDMDRLGLEEGLGRLDGSLGFVDADFDPAACVAKSQPAFRMVGENIIDDIDGFRFELVPPFLEGLALVDEDVACRRTIP